MNALPNDLINGVYRLLGELPDAPRQGLHLAHSLVTGELVTLALPAGSGSSAVELSQEGDIFGDIAHRNVHRIVDRGGDEVFIAWEYLPAWSLTDTLEAGKPVSVSVVLQLLSDIGNGLGALHSRGSVYRGLHPGRILVSRDRRARLATCPDSMNTGRGRASGIGPPSETPIRYLPPEQIEGSLDNRVDIYTAGAIGYELLTGRRLYADADPVTLAVQILKMSPEPPSRLRPDVPPELDEFMLHCLARDPAERPAGASSFLAHIRKLMDLIGADANDGFAQLTTSGAICFPLVSTTVAGVPREAAPVAGGFAVTAKPSLGQADDVAANSKAASPVTPPLASAAPGVELPAPPYQNGSAKANGVHVQAAPNGVHAQGALHQPGLPSNDSVSGNGNGNGHDGPVVPVDLEYYDDVLIVVTPNGTNLPVTTRRLLVGRGEAVTSQGGLDLATFDADHVVSRNHAELLLTTAGWVCRDLGATNGTFLNGELVPSQGQVSIRPGDALSFGAIDIRLEGVAEWATS